MDQRIAPCTWNRHAVADAVWGSALVLLPEVSASRGWRNATRRRSAWLVFVGSIACVAWGLVRCLLALGGWCF